MLVHLFLASGFVLTSVCYMHIGLGRVTGISGIIHRNFVDPQAWRFSFLFGLVATGFLLTFTHASHFPTYSSSSSRFSCLRWVIAGFLVGVGSKYGCGCTSGHMLCGVARLSRRSLLASVTFVTTAVVIHAATYSKVPLDDDVPLDYTYAKGAIDGLQLALLLLCFTVLSLYRKHVTYALSPSVVQNGIALLCGYAFAMGMVLSTMTKPSVVLGFLNLPSHPSDFDPSLLYFFLPALIPLMLLYHFGFGRWETTLFQETMEIPCRRDIDTKLLVGAVIFGLGWGLNGVCPGPALVTLGTFQYETIVFVVTMLIGFKCV